MEQNDGQLDRRRKMRFAMQFELRYKVLCRKTVIAHGAGVTLDISSNGALFRPAEFSERLTPGACIELTMCWPARLDGETPLRLIVFGQVVRGRGDWAACTFERHEFRTAALVRYTPAVVCIGSGLGLRAAIQHKDLIRAAQSCDRRAVRASG